MSCFDLRKDQKIINLITPELLEIFQWCSLNDVIRNSVIYWITLSGTGLKLLWATYVCRCGGSFFSRSMQVFPLCNSNLGFAKIIKHKYKYQKIPLSFCQSFFNYISIIWDKVFKNGPSKIYGRQPLKNLKGYGLPRQTILLRAF